jgi:hypothetical protein
LSESDEDGGKLLLKGAKESAGGLAVVKFKPKEGPGLTDDARVMGDG